MANEKTKAGRFRVAFAMILLFGPALLLIFISTRGCEHKFKKLDDYGNVPEFSFTTKTGKIISNKTLKNKIVIFTTIQPSCPNDCGVQVFHLDQLIYQQLRKNQKKMSHVKLVSIVTDGEGGQSDKISDIEATLKNEIVGYDPSIWILVKGDAKSLYNIKHNKQSLLQKGDKYFGGEAFQELMLLMDKENHLRMVLHSNLEGEIRTMRDHMNLLEKEYDQAAWKNKK
jgi:cytochrome oxidase Cu insertion factor (SCO1/SenC/PrrC family)